MLLFNCATNPHVDNLTEKQKNYAKVSEYLRTQTPYEWIMAPEGEFVIAFNAKSKKWIQKKWDLQTIQQIKSELSDSMKVELTAKGFAQAANRDDKDQKDETNYDAVWVRDSAWIFLSLLQSPEKQDDARKMILSLWDYYATKPQLSRLEAVITNPALVKDNMAVPHIRFDGKSPLLDDVMIKGKPEDWNHLQIDAHGLFLYALGLAYQKNIVKLSDFSSPRAKVLALFPEFFEKIKYWELEDAGAWEEINRRNSSSIAIVVRAMQLWEKELSAPNKLKTIVTANDSLLVRKPAPFKLLVNKGLATVKQQLRSGGESPDYDPYKNPVHFRRADAALFNLILPEPLVGLSEDELRLTLSIIENLKRPAGVIRYQNDSYQSGNFWLETPHENKSKEAMPADTGDTSSLASFLKRAEALIPNSEAQWFFDSKLAMSRLQLRKLALQRNDTRTAQSDLALAILHVKRALGQITGRINDKQLPLITADGNPVKDGKIPESINLVILDGKTFYLPSPITPLNWAKASLAMSLNQLELAFKN